MLLLYFVIEVTEASSQSCRISLCLKPDVLWFPTHQEQKEGAEDSWDAWQDRKADKKYSAAPNCLILSILGFNLYI